MSVITFKTHLSLFPSPAHLFPITFFFFFFFKASTPYVFILHGFQLVDSAEQEVTGRNEHTVVPLTLLSLSLLPSFLIHFFSLILLRSSSVVCSVATHLGKLGVCSLYCYDLWVLTPFYSLFLYSISALCCGNIPSTPERWFWPLEELQGCFLNVLIVDTSELSRCIPHCVLKQLCLFTYFPASTCVRTPSALSLSLGE